MRFSDVVNGSQDCQFGGAFPSIRRAMAKPQQRQPSRVFLPRLRHNGGCSRASRRFYATNFANSVAVPVPPAVKLGGNFAKLCELI
jgi:hypothetical protein